MVLWNGKTRRPWDYKLQGQTYEPFGNFNYGAIGATLGYGLGALLRAAGAMQYVSGAWQQEFGYPWGSSPYGDDPRDQAMIRAGYTYTQLGCHKP